MGYAYGKFPPNRCSNREFGSPDTRCLYGNSGTEPYVVAHHLLLAHAAAVKIYREKYQVSVAKENKVYKLLCFVFAPLIYDLFSLRTLNLKFEHMLPKLPDLVLL